MKNTVLLISIFISAFCNAAEIEMDEVSPSSLYIPAEVHNTPHFTIHSNASKEQTASVGTAVEALYQAYKSTLGLRDADHQLQLVLYRDQAEFKQHNRSGAPWAEAYYQRPNSFAYPGNVENPYHWMLHEVTHQLLKEASNYKPRQWLNEGMAGYFSSSQLSGQMLRLGELDQFSYPIWWLKEVRFDQPHKPTFLGSPVPSLQQLVEESGPPIGENINNYYVAWWSLTHFLMQGDGGAYRKGTIELLKNGGDPEAFHRLIGSYADIEPRWYVHLRKLVTEIKTLQED